jgi:pimeloyl-ACP methyl ester carboxylesterase
VLSGPDLIMTGATALNPEVVAAEYTVSGQLAPGATFTLAVYRAADRTLNTSQDTLLGTVTLAGNFLSPGAHTADVTLANPLGINPSERFVLVTATPTPNPNGLEVNTQNDLASFRIWTIGGVTHGFSPTGQFQTWVAPMANDLELAGYDDAIAFNWALASSLPQPGMATAAAEGMADQVVQEIESLPSKGFRTGDVVDVHLIGHSRGGGVVSLAAGLLPSDLPPGWRSSLNFLKLSLLDPHPAGPASDSFQSSSEGPLGVFALQVYVAFQKAAADLPVDIPSRVDQTEVFYQHTLVTGLTPQSDTDFHFLNYWGTVPVGADKAGTGPIVYYDLTKVLPKLGLDPSHAGPIDYYFSQVIPTLSSGGAVPLPGTTNPLKVTGAGPVSGTGLNYELGVLSNPLIGGIDPQVSYQLLVELDTFNQELANRDYPHAQGTLDQLELNVTQQRGRTVPTGLADELLAAFDLAEFLLIPQP